MPTKKTKIENAEKMLVEITEGFFKFPTTVTRNSSVAEGFKVFLRSGENSIGKSIVKDGADLFFAEAKGKKANPTEGGWAFSRGLEIVKRLKLIDATDGASGTAYATEIGRAVVLVLDGEITPSEIFALANRKASKVSKPKKAKAKKSA